MRLIDADEVIHYTKSVIESVTDKEFKEEVTRTMDALKGLLDTFDEPIPRCKDCKYWKNEINPKCTKWYLYEMKADDFCSRGEKR